MSAPVLGALERHVRGERLGRPLLAAQDGEGLRALVNGARDAGVRLAPTGHGTCLDWTRPGAASDPALHWLDATALVPEGATGIVEYVSGDGTLTASAGASMDDLRAAVREGGHRITPALPPGSTLGGVLASGRSGPDRAAFGPARHHLLGVVAVDGSGRRHRSGGRLVKNVTGFDLHRLHAGGRGRLGVIVEASLRLVPVPEASLLLDGELPTAREAVDAALAVRALPGLRLEGLVVEGRRVLVHLTGRAAQVDADAARVAAVLDARRRLEGDDADEALMGAWRGDRGLRVLTRPSRCVDAVDALLAAGVPEDALSVEPGAAIAVVDAGAARDHADGLKAEALPRLEELGALLEPRLAGAPPWTRRAPTGREADWTARLEDVFDPAGLFRDGEVRRP